jgi:hypothetical protein
MVTKNFIQTIVSGLLNRIQSHEISERELIDLLSEMEVIKPITNNENAMYTNNSGKIYIL